MKPSPPPSKGRIVHYQPFGPEGESIAAIITSADADDYVDLTLFEPGVTPGVAVNVPPAPDMNNPQPGSWFWPPRV